MTNAQCNNKKLYHCVVMKYYQEYLSMIEQRFIDEKLTSNLHGPDVYDFQHKLRYLIQDLQNLEANERKALIKGLKIMSEIGCYKAALSAKINTAIVFDTKEPDNKYVHVRGSVLFEKKKRVWVSHYIGEAKKYINNKGLIYTELKIQYRLDVVLKLIDRLKKIALGTEMGN